MREVPVLLIDLLPVFDKEGERIELDYRFHPDDESFATPVSVTGAVENRTGIVRITATAKFDYAAACARCNKPLLRHATVPVRHILVPELTDEDDSDEYIVVEDRKLDVDALVSEDVYLSIPYRLLCKPDCKGLCSICGADLNEGPCSCEKPTDPRWDALKDLLN